MKRLNDLTRLLTVKKVVPDANPAITSIHMDSREIKQNGLFFCIRGYTVDGHQFAKQAEEKGASAIVAEEEVDVSIPCVVVNDSKRAMAMMASAFYDYPTTRFRLIGITGTNGKTTTSHLVDAIMQQHQKTGLVGTMYTKIGSETKDTKNTTPESLPLQRLFAEMAEKHVETCIMEVSSHALDLGRVRGCDFNTAVFTNLTKDHLDYHKTMEAYKQAKGLLFSQLGNSYEAFAKTAVLNTDDEASADFARMCTAPILTYGIESDSDIQAENVQLTPSGTSFTLVTPWGQRNIKLSLMGRFSVYNALAAAAACLAEGVSLDSIQEGLSTVRGVSGRFEPVDVGQPYAVVVDYAHTPNSLENVLQTIQEMAEGNVYVVVGCGGDRDATKRPEMARIAVKYSDNAVFTSDNPRNEDPDQILQHMVDGVEKEDSFTVISERRQAIRYAISRAKRNDIVLIAGKGHETYQIIGNQVLDFDDRKEAESSIIESSKDQ
ncbi:UDP-N-acetylmuramoylalanyl-D-glutamate--2,6-diaminopimelate ligase [Alteribacillus persepolensis]|uniref:UDP-N-acetylmuramoyl-L-alanyl-D-glutamate--2,6-diaminopimelate ligase n=1 Tax=Alteribacillus persepolensis TaxID=568899 RepID=A0A1G7YEL4_9BACI|nr:UDP-N-acetylmuramoyl-L-alanyl-D-glutamate--2,6-diaminopimelate ligase [Alteribacillus persepolensis]SDG95012.1 UDP-N-acetylmuramoylalanyl-D-glutamate--2,6-diaminopimelate ligase [Alteribacillus persepolensis]